MKNIPNKLQCAYCVRNHTHGGECYTQKCLDEKGCLVFKYDERGCIRSNEGILSFPLYNEIPFLNIWQDGWTVNNAPSEIKIIHIKGLSWDTKGGFLYIHCRYYYFYNEYHEDFIKPEEKPKLKLIK